MGALHVGLLSLLAASTIGDYDFGGGKASAVPESSVGFFNAKGRFEAGLGSFTLGATDHVTGPDLTYGDAAQFQAQFMEGANQYQVELIRAGFPPVQALPPRDQRAGRVPPPPTHRIDGGVMLDTDVFGTAGLGPRELARAHAAIAVFGVGRVFKNGKLLTDRARIEVTALSNTIIAPDGGMLLTPQEGRSQLLVIADNLPPAEVPGGVLEFGFDDVQIVVNGALVNPPPGVAQAPEQGPGGEQAGVGGAGAAGVGGAAGAPPMVLVPIGATPLVVPPGSSPTGVTVSPAPAPTAEPGTAAAAGGATAAGTGAVTGPTTTEAAGAFAVPQPFIAAQPLTSGVVGAPVPLAPGLSQVVLPAPTPVYAPEVSRDLSETLNGRPPLEQRTGVPAATLAPPGVIVPSMSAGTVTSGTSIFSAPTLTTPGLSPQPSAPVAGTPGAPAAGTPGAPAAGTPGAPAVATIGPLGPETTGGIVSDRTSAAPGFMSIGSPRQLSSVTQVPGRSGNAASSFSSVGIPGTPEPLNAQPATPLPFTPTPLNAGPAAALPLTATPSNVQLVGAPGTPGSQVPAGAANGTGAIGQAVPAGAQTVAPGSVTGAPSTSATTVTGTAAGTATTGTAGVVSGIQGAPLPAPMHAVEPGPPPLAPPSVVRGR